MSLTNDISKRLKQFLKDRKMKPGEFAENTGLPVQNVYKWARGTKPSDPEDYKIIENYLNGKLENVPRETTKPMGTEEDPKEKLLLLKDTTIKAQEETIKALNIQINTIEKVSSSDALKILKENNALLHFLVEKLVPLPKGATTHIWLNEKKAANEKEGK